MKKYVATMLVLGGLTIGEFVQPYTSIKNSIQYHNVPLERNTPIDPWNYELKRELVEKDGLVFQGLYLINEDQGIHKKIDEDGCTCAIGTSIDEFLEDKKDSFQSKVQEGVDWLKETYTDLTEDKN